MAEFTKSLRVGATSLILWCELAAVAASAPAAPRAFENGLRRAIAVQGQEQAKFTLAQRMAHYCVPGTSVAVIQRCRIVDVRGFGTFAGGGPKVTPHSLFQPGSIARPSIDSLRMSRSPTIST